jgi:hypothetical protein
VWVFPLESTSEKSSELDAWQARQPIASNMPIRKLAPMLVLILYRLYSLIFVWHEQAWRQQTWRQQGALEGPVAERALRPEPQAAQADRQQLYVSYALG